MTLYADDPDVHVDYEIADDGDGTLDWTPVIVQAGDTDLTSTWQGATVSTAGVATRTLRVPLAGLTAGEHHPVRLVVPSGNDVDLGTVYLN